MIKTAKYLEVNDLYVITFDEEINVKIDGFTIHIIPIWKWLLR